MKLTRRRVVVASITILLAVVTGWYFAASQDELSTEWHEEEIFQGENVTWDGTHWNGFKALTVKSHSWKIIGKSSLGGYDWGFKVVLEFPENAEYSKNKWGDFITAVMPIQALKYDLYDADGFHLTSLELDNYDVASSSYGEIGYVNMGENKTFQGSDRISEITARRAAYGKLNIMAGYELQNPVDLDYLDKLSNEGQSGQPLEKVTPQVATPE